MDRRRTLALILGTTLAIGSVGQAAATHTLGVLDCGPAGTFEVQAASVAPLPKFEAPVPWSGLFLLEGTNRVFRAFAIETPRWSIELAAVDHNPRPLVTCSLTSSGLNFEEPWILAGMLVP